MTITPFLGSLSHPSKALAELLADTPVVIVPGLRNSDERHWQSRWQAEITHSQRVQLDAWDRPDLAKWKAGINRELDTLDQPAVLIAHSFGTLASASIALERPEAIAALFLVAPADPDKFGIAAQLPQDALAPATKIIASSNDPWLTDTKAAFWAQQWGADFLRLEGVGHINSDSNLGIWPQGIAELAGLLRQTRISSNAQVLTAKKNRAA